MIAKTITFKELDEAIRVAFSEDKKIYELYDPNVVVENVDQISEDIIKKLKTHSGIVLKGVYEKNRLIGFFVRAGGLLVSFSLAMQYRVRKYLNNFWHLIREEFKGIFKCYLWSKNKRAIKFLQKHGAIITNWNDLLTELTIP
jgi:hypothetical protein